MTRLAQKKRRLPKWIRDTLEAVLTIAVLMAVYNFLGPFAMKNGAYFPWWMYPWSVLASLLVVGAWNFAARKFRLMNQQLKDEEAAKKAHQEQLAQQGAAREKTAAVKRRNRNQSKQQSRP